MESNGLFIFFPPMSAFDASDHEFNLAVFKVKSMMLLGSAAISWLNKERFCGKLIKSDSGFLV